MGVYRVTTDGGTYDVTTDDGASTPQPQTPSIASQGLGYLAQHPVLSAMQPLAKTITGTSLQDMAQNASQMPIPQARQAPFDSNVQMAGSPIGNAIRTGVPAIAGTLGGVADQLTSPINAALGPLAKGAITGTVHTAEALPAVLNSAKGAQFAQSIRQAFVGVKKAAVDKFGNDLDALAIKNPDKTVSLGDVVKNINENFDDMSTNAKSALRNTPVLRDFLPKADGTVPPAASAEMDNVKLSDIQKIINHMNTKIPGNIKSSDLDLLNTLQDVKAAQLDAFPEMSQIRANYAQVAQPHQNLQNYFKFNKLLGAIKGGFGGDEGQQAIEKLLPPDVLQKIGSYKNAIGLVNGVKKAGIATGIGALGYGGFAEAKHLIK